MSEQTNVLFDAAALPDEQSKQMRIWLNGEDVTSRCLRFYGSPEPNVAVEGWCQLVCLDARGTPQWDGKDIKSVQTPGIVVWELKT